MIYAKSILVGAGFSLFAWFVAAVVYTRIALRPKVRELREIDPNASIGVDPRVFLRPWFLVVALVGFAFGFYWAFRG